MKTCLRIVFPVIILLSAAPAHSQNQDMADVDFSKLETHIKDQLDSLHIPSVSIAVVYKGKIILEKSFGWADRDQHIPATIHTPYYLASVTKTITATALIKLKEKNLIDWDKPVNSYLKHAKVYGYFWDGSEATVKRMATHTSGLTTYNQSCSHGNARCMALDTIIRRYGVIVQKPGQSFDYSNLGYGVLGQVIADVSGKSFSDYLRDEIFIPLGMNDSYLKNSFTRSMPQEKRSSYKYKPYPPYEQSPDEISYAAGASSVYSSIHDLAVFANFQLGHRLPGVDANVISDSARRYMRASQVPIGRGKSYGIGLWLDSSYYGYYSALAQGGTVDAQTAIQLLPSEDLGVVFLSNSGSLYFQPIINEALAAVLPGFRDKLSKPAPAAQASPTPVVTGPQDSLIGKWTGFIRTYKRDIPLTLEISASAKCTFQLNAADNIEIKNPRFRNHRVSFVAPGNLDIADDTGPDPYNLHFYINQSKDIFYGIVTTEATPGSFAAALSCWVQLTKIDH